MGSFTKENETYLIMAEAQGKKVAGASWVTVPVATAPKRALFTFFLTGGTLVLKRWSEER